MKYELCVNSDISEKMLESLGAGCKGKQYLQSSECLGDTQALSYLLCEWFSLGHMYCTALHRKMWTLPGARGGEVLCTKHAHLGIRCVSLTVILSSSHCQHRHVHGVVVCERSEFDSSSLWTCLSYLWPVDTGS